MNETSQESHTTELLKLKQGVIYGPVSSRRLGKSLGINLLPRKDKVCSFDCIYCQYGRTRRKMAVPEEDIFPAAEEVLPQVERALKERGHLDYITFSGNGEPTIHPDFGRIVEHTVILRNEIRPGIPTAILTNSSRLSEKEIMRAVSRLDKPIAKLDAGNAKDFMKISRPHPDIDFEAVLGGIKSTKNATIQSVLFGGPISNSKGKSLDSLIEAIAYIQPVEVQIYSTVRPVPSASIIQLPGSRLREIASLMHERLKVPVRAY